MREVERVASLDLRAPREASVHLPVAMDDPERPLPRALLGAPGGFAWWYADLVDEQGSGLVLIWSFGLPFLPGYASAARRGAAQRPGDRPSLNVAVYDRGTPSFYLLQELDPREVEWGEGDARFRFGDTIITSERARGRRTLRVALDCTVPGTSERLVGEVVVEGAPRRVAAGEVHGGSHLWTPLVGPARGAADLAFGGRTLSTVEGRAYHDRNGGFAPLHGLGFRRWLWGRLAMPDHELVYYALDPDDDGPTFELAVAVYEDGRTELLDVEIDRGAERRATYGMPYWTEVRIRVGGVWQRVHLEHTVDDGPFYLRHLTRAGTARGVSEIIVPSRIDRALERPLVRMRVHHTQRENSRWLPLFTGPRQGRVSRLVSSMLGSR